LYCKVGLLVTIDVLNGGGNRDKVLSPRDRTALELLPWWVLAVEYMMPLCRTLAGMTTCFGPFRNAWRSGGAETAQ